MYDLVFLVVHTWMIAGASAIGGNPGLVRYARTVPCLSPLMETRSEVMLRVDGQYW